MQFYEFPLSNSLTQLDIAEWAMDAMQNIPQDEAEELWGESFEEYPIKIEDRSLFIADNEEVVRDFLYRVEIQYIAMAKDEGEREYASSLRAVMLLSNKIRSLFGMELVETEDLAI